MKTTTTTTGPAGLTALARKRIAAAAVARLDAIGLYDADYPTLADAIAAELGTPIGTRADREEVADRIADLVAWRVEAGAGAGR